MRRKEDKHHFFLFLLLKRLFFVVFFLVLALLSLKIFAENTFDAFVKVMFHSKDTILTEDELSIAFPDTFFSFEPTSYKASDRSRLINIYETLVRTDKDLRIEPSLALSWGLLDDKTYQFILRPNVKFHDGTLLTSSQVKSSIERAQFFQDSEVSNLLTTLSHIDIIDDRTFRIVTTKPDPLLLNKLTAIFIFSSDGLKNLSEKPVGTGPYRFFQFDSSTSTLVLKAFADYWGQVPKYRYLKILSIFDQIERIDAVKNGSVDILASVPPSFVSELEPYDLEIISEPSLEANFLFFRLSDEKNNVFSDKRLREAVVRSIDTSKLVQYTDSHTQPLGQFVVQGVFGYDPEIVPISYDLESARDLMKEVTAFLRIPVTIALPNGFESFGRYLYDQLYSIGFSPKIQYLEVQNFEESIALEPPQIYLFGWRFELADSYDFFQSVIHSLDSASQYGVFNASGYSNSQVDALIEQSSETIEPDKRAQLLHQIMKIIMFDDIIGVPLFRSSVIYAMKKGIVFKPRLDGYIYASQIR
ncbi:hypothetical protein HYV56_00840 [Candidatus Peregrinibacteria bacterium]|nr:hypothetical protein [Candidatus Peregrinibacteria bacterium]